MILTSVFSQRTGICHQLLAQDLLTKGVHCVDQAAVVCSQAGPLLRTNRGIQAVLVPAVYPLNQVGLEIHQIGTVSCKRQNMII